METLQAHECWALLRAADVGRLAVSVAGEPDIFPVNHVVDGGSVVFRTAQGSKLAAVTVAPAVAYEADGYDAGRGVAWSVVVKGRAQEVRSLEELGATFSLPLFPWQAGPKERFVRIVPTTVTGRRFRRATDGSWPPPAARARAAAE
ncbi:pyridoxamine 5'-phosphate oxidase family protein [Motilibacter sp. K478]|nr:pyridoxamine 5'-phosphate oxidase family protein [Motilibacter aurantiacus]